MNTSFKGVFSALITPFQGQLVDYDSLERLINYQLENGIQGFVINGTTAESPTLSLSEVKKIYSLTRAIVGISFPLILGTGTNSTETTLENTKLAAELGADGALIVVPYYNKPTQKGLREHFKFIAKNSEIPIVMYNVPGRTITSMSEETIIELSEVKNICGLKEASGNIEFDKELIKKLRKDFYFLSGDDGTYLDFLQIGGNGIISVMSNLIAKQTVNWTEWMLTGEVEKAKTSFERYKKLIDVMYIESNPIPIKWMLYKKGIIKSPEMRLPLTTLDEKYHEQVLSLMKQVDLI